MIARLFFLALLAVPWTAQAQVMGLLGAEMTPCPTGCGLRIVDILPGSPAHQAGLLPGDVIKAINGKEVYDDIIAVVDFIRNSPGLLIYLTVFRQGRTSTGPVRLGAVPLAPDYAPPHPPPTPVNHPQGYPAPPAGTTVINNNFFGDVRHENTTNQHGNGNRSDQLLRR